MQISFWAHLIFQIQQWSGLGYYRNILCAITGLKSDTTITTCTFVQRDWDVSAKVQACSVCPDIKDSGQVVSVPTAVRRGSGRRSLGPTKTCRTRTGIPTSQAVLETMKTVCRWRPSTTAISNGRLSTVPGCYVRSVSSTFNSVPQRPKQHALFKEDIWLNAVTFTLCYWQFFLLLTANYRFQRLTCSFVFALNYRL